MPKPVRYVEVFRPGTFQPMVGAAVTLTADDLKAIASAYDADGAPAPAVVGHPKTDSPAYAWATNFTFDEATGKLLAGFSDIDPGFEEAVRAKTYRKISLSLFRPDAANNPKPGQWYPKHVGFLGGAAPAVSGLKPVDLASDADGTVTIEFGEPGFRDVASLFRRVREWMIGEAGLEKADQVIPDYQIAWIENYAFDPDDDKKYFSERREPAPTPKGSTMPTPAELALAAREADLAAQAADLAKREAKIRHDEHASFAEELVTEGRLLPVLKDKVVALQDALATAPATDAEFADGGAQVKTPVLTLVRDILKAQPPVVSFGSVDMPSERMGSADFSAPHGMAIDAAGLETLAKAKAYQAKNPTVSFLDAVKAVSA